MNLVDSYLAGNGYDYYGNAAEDTLVFFVHDAAAPTAEPPGRNKETQTEIYNKTRNCNTTNFDSNRNNTPSDK